MPEGDTVWKIAAAMRPLVEGKVLAELWTRDRGVVGALAGRTIDEVASLGKHLLVVIGEHVLHVHLGMHGRWEHVVRGAAAPAFRDDAVVALATDVDLLVCRRAAVAELLRRVDVRTHPRLSRLGPDFLAPGFDAGEAVTRARARQTPTLSVADALLDQTVACGAGNVFKSEAAFVERLDPKATIATLADARLVRLFETTRALMRGNLGGWPRTTTVEMGPGRAPPRERLWVYGRAGEPCLVCRTPIERERAGDDARSTYWCPRCAPSA